MASKSAIRIIETSKISPPIGSILTSSIPLTFFDVIWLPLPPVESLFFYPFPHSTSEFLSSYVSTLKSSLSLALRSFYPLADNTRLVPNTVEKHEIHCTDADFVPFIVAESTLDLDDLTDDKPREITKLKLLVPRLCMNESHGLSPNMAIQITIFPSHGFVIGISMRHAVCDGYGLMNFIRSWASIHLLSSSTTTLTPASVTIDRSIIPDPYGSIYSAIFDDMNNASVKHSEIFTPSNQGIFISSFTLNEEHIKLLKKAFIHESAKRNIAVNSSTIVVTYAFIWIGYVKAKSLIVQDDDARCTFVVDLRNWFHPAIPEAYFGNCLGPCFLRASAVDLLGQDGFFVACQTISKGFEEMKRHGIKCAKDWIKNIIDGVSKKPLGAAGSPRFKVYDVDFGWGKPIKVEMTSIANTGAMSIAESKGGHGGVDVGLCFTKHEMDVFKKYFEESLQGLSTID